MLERIFEHLRQNQKLSKKLEFSITKKPDHHKRLSKLFRYEGPDQATIEVLRAKQAIWISDPAKFWTVGQSKYSFQDPLVEIVGCGLSLELDNAHSRIVYRHLCLLLHTVQRLLPSPPVGAIATFLFESKKFTNLTIDKMEAFTREMTTAGSRFHHLESDLGEGVALVLGMDAPETT